MKVDSCCFHFRSWFISRSSASTAARRHLRGSTSCRAAFPGHAHLGRRVRSPHAGCRNTLDSEREMPAHFRSDTHVAIGELVLDTCEPSAFFDAIRPNTIHH